MNIIGVSAYFHDAACCLLQDGKLVSAVQEERFSRQKNERRLPVRAFRYCLEAGGIDIVDVDCIAYYENPTAKLARQLWMRPPLHESMDLFWLDARRPEREIREIFGYEGPIEFFEHHLSHAAASFYFSGFERAAILTTDAVGEWATTTYAVGEDSSLKICDTVHFPDSIGLFYSSITQYLGFKVLSDEYKVMGLAPYGNASYANALRNVICVTDDGKFKMAKEYFNFSQGGKMYTEELVSLLGEAPRKPETEITQFHKDVASSLQSVCEYVLLEQVRHLRKFTDATDLCLSGGVALNCVANSRIRRESGFERLFVQPAAGDAGSALGAAALAHVRLTGERHSSDALEHVYLGPKYSNEEIDSIIRATGLEALDFRDRFDELLEAVVDRLTSGKVVAWFQGRMEFGPRALGARSILADPRNPNMRDRLNNLVKKREAFRPFGPVILEERVTEHMLLDHLSPFMLETCPVRSDIELPAITHIDGSCRPQTLSPKTNPRLARLLVAFDERTKCPLLVNTSFNIRGEPIVCSPADALRCLAVSGIDVLVMEDFLIDRHRIENVLQAGSQLMDRTLLPTGSSDEHDAAYTFT